MTIQAQMYFFGYQNYKAICLNLVYLQRTGILYNDFTSVSEQN